MKRILLVEDDPGIAYSLRLDLKTEGYDVEVESDGAKALARARSERGKSAPPKAAPAKAPAKK